MITLAAANSYEKEIKQAAEALNRIVREAVSHGLIVEFEVDAMASVGNVARPMVRACVKVRPDDIQGER